MSRATLLEIVRDTAQALRDLSPDEAQTEARLLVAAAAGLPPREVFRFSRTELSAPQEASLRSLLSERLTGKPLQYILGEWEFMGLPFKTDARALIPRQDTETLCEACLALIRGRGYKSCLDLCCGSGCVGISLARLSGIRVALADVDGAALSLARENAAINNVSAAFMKSDLLENVRGRYDLVACNPPYLSDADMRSLQREVAFEPRGALYGGADGLDFYRALAQSAMEFINPGGALVMEVGFGQAEAVSRLFPKTERTRDLNGIERVVTAYR